MGESKKKGHITVKIPTELIEEIDTLIKSQRFGFRSRGEFVKEAVRKLLDHYRSITPISVEEKEKGRMK